MAIDPKRERLITLAEAATLYPRRQRGQTISLSSVYRHTTRGCRGVVLEWLFCGGMRATSAEAVYRFFERLTERASGNRTVATKSMASMSRATRKAVEYSADRTESELDRIFGRRSQAARGG